MKQENRIHTFAQSLIFRGKSSLLQLKRGFENAFDRRIERFSAAENLAEKSIIAESKTPLWTEAAPEEQFLLAGKVENLRAAIKHLDGLEIPANEVFSFWKSIGRATRRRGFVEGRELREGCLIPNVGGGLCQLSNALYDAALQAGFEIVERHAHSQIVAGSLAEKGRDATVFWNYVDLRFRSVRAFRIEAKLGKDHLRVKFKGDAPQKSALISISKKDSISSSDAPQKTPNSCATCGVESCFRSLKNNAPRKFGRAAFLVDEFAPEFDDYIQKAKTPSDILFVPLDGKRFRKANYAWTTKEFERVEQKLLITLKRSYKSRKLAAQSAARQKNLLAMHRKLAESYAKSLRYDQTHLIIQQNLLPFLWRSGALGGRTFDVLMAALPMKNLQENLDFAAALHPSSPTLGDFRADDKIVEAETEALENAERIITAHTAIAAPFGKRATLLEWKLPTAKKSDKKRNEKFTIVFPASTVGRKGCYELREALRGLDVKLLTLGAELEGANFWHGIDCEKGGGGWLERADLVVLPAFVEHKPRRLLQAAANRIPVIASKNCGLENVKVIQTIEAGDAAILRNAIENYLPAD